MSQELVISVKCWILVSQRVFHLDFIVERILFNTLLISLLGRGWRANEVILSSEDLRNSPSK